jgi:hypothetical protein
LGRITSTTGTPAAAGQVVGCIDPGGKLLAGEVVGEGGCPPRSI